jgi:TonB family protein
VLELYERHEAEYRRRLGVAGLVTIALQAVFLLVLHRMGWNPLDVPERLHLGYPGRNLMQPELEVLEPNSVQAYFYQKAREGRARAIEYRILQPIELTPGPDPVALRDVETEEQPVPRPDEMTMEEVPDVVMPLTATHRQISYSEDFQIIKLVKPTYPEYELSQGIRGRLLVAVWVTPQGDLENEQILDATTDPPSASSRGFEIATLEAVRQWKVRPPRQMAGMQGMWLTIPVQFDPKRDDFLDLERLKSR